MDSRVRIDQRTHNTESHRQGEYRQIGTRKFPDQTSQKCGDGVAHHSAHDLISVEGRHGTRAEILSVDNQVGRHLAAESQPEQDSEQVEGPRIVGKERGRPL